MRVAEVDLGGKRRAGEGGGCKFGVVNQTKAF